jgi:D-beta-D-heptose 7-phosphate kinase/D-beta-D-heptose 1-phosphate adenosyltransferase
MIKKVFTNGCFDLLHRGHIELLKFARNLGDELIVAIDSDMRVKELKGSTRPIYSLEDRIEILSSIKYIDKIYSFSTDEELENIVKKHSPYYLVKGSDWTSNEIIGSKFVKEVILFDRINGLSTTQTIQNITDR